MNDQLNVPGPERAPRPQQSRRRGGFSLIELVIVVVIIGIIAAIAIPRMSRGAAAAADSALAQNLAMLRGAIDLYQAEHEGSYPPLADLEDLLTQYSNSSGSVTATAKNTATGVIYGPYLRAIPPMSVGSEKGRTGIGTSIATGTAWIYTESTGDISAALAGSDSAGRAYSDY